MRTHAFSDIEAPIPQSIEGRVATWDAVGGSPLDLHVLGSRTDQPRNAECGVLVTSVTITRSCRLHATTAASTLQRPTAVFRPWGHTARFTLRHAATKTGFISTSTQGQPSESLGIA